MTVCKQIRAAATGLTLILTLASAAAGQAVRATGSEKGVGVEQLLVGRGYLGVQYAELTPELRQHFGADPGAGVMVSRVVPGAPAERSGLQVGDILVAIDGKPIDSGLTLGREVGRRAAGEAAGILVLRDGRLSQLEVVFEEREPSVVAVRPQIDGRLRLITPGGSARESEVDVDDALAVLEGFLGSGEWREFLSSFEGLSLEQVQERMREVEQQLRELEVQMSEPPNP